MSITPADTSTGIIRKKAAWKARRDAIDAAAKEAERRALEGDK